ncbi:ABC transporter permease [Negadavirga shengliensis]|uniref:ABC transporter permease n=1 Tax=Negadavirga shengliensis TaxID=1389218 RepID=A0ABV9T6S9_9BACT
MLKNHFKVAWRYLWQSKGSTFLHIGGLAVAMAAAILILLWGQNELRYDNYHQDVERIYLLTSYDSARGVYFGSGVSPYAASSVIGETVPEVEQIAMANTNTRNYIFEINGHRFKEDDALIVDNNWVNMFDYKVLQGSLDNFLNNPHSVILTASRARQYFGDTPPLQQIFSIDSVAYSVGAVVEDLPANSSFQQGTLIPTSVYQTEGADAHLKTWGFYSQLLFIKLFPNTSVSQAERKITNIFHNNQPWNKEIYINHLIPLMDLHFKQELSNPVIAKGNPRNLWIFTVLAILLLAVAGVNFVNLSIARIGFRMKEIGIRKIVGAAKNQLFAQVMVETMLAVALAMGFALLVALIALPDFNAFSERNLTLNLLDLPVTLLLLGVFLTVLLLTGVYPALLLATLKPVGLLKNQGLAGMSRQGFRKVLVTGQLVFTVVMMVGIVTIHRQFVFIQQQTDGYQKEQVFKLYVPFQLGFKSSDNEAVQKHVARTNSVKTRLLASSAIHSVSRVNGASMIDDKRKYPTEITWLGYAEAQDPLDVVNIQVDEDYAEMANLVLLSGRWFDMENSADKYNLILNETAVKEYGLKEPVVGTVFSGGIYWDEGGTVIGVVKDYHHKSLHEKIDPVVFTLDPFNAPSYLVKAHAGNVPQALDHARKVWEEFVPEHPFDYSFLDVEFERLYKNDRKALFLSTTFGGLSILLSCLGLLGMVSVSVQQRTKEIGVRKVLGSSASGIVAMLSLDFVILVGIAILIATPIAWYAMNRWLEDFAYRIDIEWWMFGLAGLAALVIALMTVSFQSVKAALANPVDSLRNE